jgi:hypothetical protein
MTWQPGVPEHRMLVLINRRSRYEPRYELATYIPERHPLGWFVPSRHIFIHESEVPGWCDLPEPMEAA